MSEHYPRIRLYSVLGGERRSLYIRESVSLTFYMRCSHQEIVQQVMRSLESYLRAIGPQVLGWYVDPYSLHSAHREADFLLISNAAHSGQASSNRASA